ncbi:hypothetical protein KC686_01100 [Candidatus Woesebacteria bacterium]|nr:hypothetical protein [Candidatus Woesebacteria bacterium]
MRLTSTGGTRPVQIVNGSLMVGYLQTDATDRGTGNLLVSGNVGIGTTTPNAKLDVNGLILAQSLGSAPAGVSGHAGIFAQDVSGSSELFALDAAGNTTQLSPHNPATGTWWFNSSNTITGESLLVDMEGLIKQTDLLLGGGYITENGTTTSSSTNYLTSTQANTTQLAALSDTVAAVDLDQYLEKTTLENNVTLTQSLTKFVKKVVFAAQVTFQQSVSFMRSVTFDGVATFYEAPVLSDNMAGQATILSGSTRVEVAFSTSFSSTPVVTVTPHAFTDGQYRITQQSTTGFVIELSQPQGGDTVFSWQALQVSQVGQAQSSGSPLPTPIPSPDPSSPSVDPTPSPTPEPSVTPLSSPSPTPEPSVSPSPSPEASPGP